MQLVALLKGIWGLSKLSLNQIRHNLFKVNGSK
jgi:hypothetical protein